MEVEKWVCAKHMSTLKFYLSKFEITMHQWQAVKFKCFRMLIKKIPGICCALVPPKWVIIYFIVQYVRMNFLCFRKGDRIYHQLKKLGGSYDWDRACFTMDPVSFYVFKSWNPRGQDGESESLCICLLLNLHYLYNKKRIQYFIQWIEVP